MAGPSPSDAVKTSILATAKTQNSSKYQICPPSLKGDHLSPLPSPWELIKSANLCSRISGSLFSLAVTLSLNSTPIKFGLFYTPLARRRSLSLSSLWSFPHSLIPSSGVTGSLFFPQHDESLQVSVWACPALSIHISLLLSLSPHLFSFACFPCFSQSSSFT